MWGKLSKYRVEIAGLLLGAIAGWCYWYYVGCAFGICPITSKPLNSTLYGSAVGMFALSLFKKEHRKSNS